mmetsp:Transcript_35784/g.82600  ORF Transcript_35784/g.82600 Transcript_35784/m.82600 type:complete len:909 (+) Transcript_35784:88-2814(+)
MLRGFLAGLALCGAEASSATFPCDLLPKTRLGEGEAFRCDGLVTSDGGKKFDMRFTDAAPEVESLELYANVTATLQYPLDWKKSHNGPGKSGEVKAAVYYMNDIIPLSTDRFVASTDDDSSLHMATRLFCIKGSGPKKTTFSMVVQGSVDAQVGIRTAAKPSLVSGNRHALSVGGSGGRSAFQLLNIREDTAMDLWRLSFSVPERFQAQSVSRSYHAYVMHETSTCISLELASGGCFDANRVLSCVESVPVSFKRLDPFRAPQIAMSLSFRRSATMTLSKASLPALRPGRWLVLVLCNPDELQATCPYAEIDMEFFSEDKEEQRLLRGAVIMVFGPVLILFGANGMYWLAYQLLHRLSMTSPRTTVRLWPVFMSCPGRDHILMLREKLQLMQKPLPFFPTLLCLLLGVFLATAAQFVLSHYGLMVRTGNRDICFYNEKCYYPGIYSDLPWNHMLSNLAYFVAGLHTMFQAFLAESRCRKFSRANVEKMFGSPLPSEKGLLTVEHWNKIFEDVDCNNSGRISRQEWYNQYGHFIAFDFVDKDGTGYISRAEWSAAFRSMDLDQDKCLSQAKLHVAVHETARLDLRVFYAIAISFMGEGVGSMCYHVCPSVETFQFDTCFMIPIANLFTFALVEWKGTAEDTSTCLKYFVYVLTPIWLINFIGTWFDIEVFTSSWPYCFYTLLVLAWTLATALGLRRLFPARDMGCWGECSLRILQCFVVSVVLLAYMRPSVRAALGGTANVFLLLSIVIMIVVVSRQIWLLDMRFISCEAYQIGARLIKNSYLVVMVLVAALALKCFNEKVVIVTPKASAAESHDANQECVHGIFDLHDCWHFLSAIALALFAMLMLDIRVHSWARATGIPILFEATGDLSLSKSSSQVTADECVRFLEEAAGETEGSFKAACSSALLK